MLEGFLDCKIGYSQGQILVRFYFLEEGENFVKGEEEIAEVNISVSFFSNVFGVFYC